MRFTVILAIAAILTPAALTAHPAAQSGTTVATDLSAAKKKKQKAPAKPKEEYLKAAPGTGPSGPAKK